MQPIDLFLIILASFLEVLSLVLLALKLGDILSWFGCKVAFGDGLEERVVFFVGLDEGIGGGIG